jgi:acyl CoA:acetate/3-ketoacid CoA transferase alpha subunit
MALAIRERFLNTGHPRGLTLTHGPGAGDTKTRGECSLAEEGLVKRLIVGHVGTSPRMARLVEENKIECYFLPQGVMCQLFTEISRKGPGVLTKVGLGTFVDPRVEGGKVNDVTKEDILKVVEFEDEEWMFYPSYPIDVAILKGTAADENGNFTVEKEGKILDNYPIALAAKASGGIVIVQVETLVEAGTLHPKRVKVPGTLVDYIVVAEKPQWQSMVTQYNPSFSGEVRVPLKSLKQRGLEGTQLFIGDKCLGLLEAVNEVFPNSKFQRCTVHFYRNVFAVTPRSKMKEVAAMLKAIHAQESKEAAKEKALKVVAKLRDMKLKEAAKKIEDSILETLTYMDFPYAHWSKLRSNNVIERLNREIRRRTRVVGTFPDGNSALMLVCARLRHVASKTWGTRRYMSMTHLYDMQKEESNQVAG